MFLGRLSSVDKRSPSVVAVKVSFHIRSETYYLKDVLCLELDRCFKEFEFCRDSRLQLQQSKIKHIWIFSVHVDSHLNEEAQLGRILLL